jgi:membrane associated rhomboid family serine protease
LESPQSGRREPVFNAPTIVVVLIACLVIVHTVRQLLDYGDDGLVIMYMAFIPARLTEIGAGLPGGVLAGYTSTFTHALLHADWLHLMLNSAWLLAFGALIARRCGPLGFLGLFAASSIAGAVFFFLVNANQMVPLVGASGGVSGLMGAAFRVIFSANAFGGLQTMREHPLAIPRMPLQVALFDRSTMLGVGLWLAVNLIFGLGLGDIIQSGEIAWEAHVGGFLFGFLLFRWFDKGPGYKEMRMER